MPTIKPASRSSLTLRRATTTMGPPPPWRMALTTSSVTILFRYTEPPAVTFTAPAAIKTTDPATNIASDPTPWRA